MTSACIRYLGVVRGRTDRRDQGFLYFCLDDCSAPADSSRAAEEMGINLSTAKTRLRRGRARLKEYLREVGYEFAEG